MNQFELEDLIVKDLQNSHFFKGEQPILSGNIYKQGTRFRRGNEDVIVEVQSINDAQIQRATVSIRFYVDDMDFGSPLKVPNISRLAEIAAEIERCIGSKVPSDSHLIGDTSYKITSLRREQRKEFQQHCLNLMLEFRIPNFGLKAPVFTSLFSLLIN